MEKGKKDNRCYMVSESIRKVKEQRDGGSHDSLRNREVQESEGGCRTGNKNKKMEKCGGSSGKQL